MANLLVEIGNTAVKAAWSEETILGKTFRYQGENITEFILSITEKEKAEVMAIISKTPLKAEDEELLRKECEVFLPLNDSTPEILQRNGLPEYLSYDRAAAIIAAKYLFRNKPCSIFDFGTTLTIDFINPDGMYTGGNVSVGCRTRFNSINRYSSNLPLVNAPVQLRQEGTSLVSSVESGVVFGMIFEIEGYIRLHPDNIAIFTGGDAMYFAKRMKNSIFVVSNLILIGLAVITDNYVKKTL